MKGVVIKASRTLLRRLWHKHSASQLLEIVWEESMLLDELVAGQQTPTLAKVYVPANPYMIKTVRQLKIRGPASVLFMCIVGARLQ